MSFETFDGVVEVAMAAITFTLIALGMAFTILMCVAAWQWGIAKVREYKERARLNSIKFLKCKPVTAWAGWLKLTNDRKLKLLPEMLSNPRLGHGIECHAETSHGHFEIPIKEITCSLGGDDDKVVAHFETEANKEGWVEMVHFIYKGVCLKPKYLCLTMNEGDVLKLRYTVEMDGTK